MVRAENERRPDSDLIGRCAERTIAHHIIPGANIITFNDVLRIGGIDPVAVKLLRHTVKGKQILEIWRSDRKLAEAYQSRQKLGFFDEVTHAACFLVSRSGTEVFGGLYEVHGWVAAAPDDIDPLTGDPHDGTRVVYDLRRVAAYESYEDRLVVQWFLAGKHPGWWQWAQKNPKPIVEIAMQRERPFPGWLEFRCPVDGLEGLPGTWRETLRATSGVYLLTDAIGKHYVGSAKGGDGLLGRWDAYKNGHTGGNVGLAGATGPFTVCVLQTVDPATSEQAIERIESRWKEKLGARSIGYNLN